MARRPILFLALVLLTASPVLAQETDEAEEDVALAIKQQTWRVIETKTSTGDRWDATWTLLPDGKSFDAHWKHFPGGDTGVNRSFVHIRSVKGNQIVIDRPGLGTYSGTISSDRRKISGKMSWCPCTWKVEVEGGETISADGTVRTVSKTWNVVDTVLSTGERWEATWTLLPDGKSFDAHWKHFPGGDTGVNRNFVHIRSIKGNQIVIDRPGLGTYSGTISSDRRKISGKTSWCHCSWVVRLPDPLPATLP
jgi:hypothetical protein